VSVLPKLPRDAGDRNRTSPLAFTGNKFEFRAVSANQSIAFPNIAMNVAMTEALDYLATELEKAVRSKKTLDQAVKDLLPKMINENKRIIFNGNNYADAWRKDASKRGLLNHTNTVDALPELTKPEVVRIFEKYKVLNARELHARYDVAVETYVKTVNVEAQLMVLMANRYILPAALKYQKDVAESVAAVRNVGGSVKEAKRMLDRLSSLVDDLRQRTDRLANALDEHAPSAEKHAKYMRDTIVPAMNALRETGDQIELMVPHELWPLPTYREMLFIK
jgi:glutamine synthetase